MQIIVKLTTACNLRCVYCSEGDQVSENLSPMIFYKLVDDLPEFLEASGETLVEFLWHGGEPLLYGREALGNLMDYARAHLEKYEVRFLMQTNGYLVDKEWIAFFLKYGISPGVSMDGYPELHDANRQTPDGKPTAEVVLRNIRMMKDAGLNVGTLMVINTETPIDSKRLYEFFQKHELNPKIHAVMPCGRANGRDDTRRIYENYVQLLEELYEKCALEGGNMSIEPLEEILYAILGIAPIKECSFSGSCARNFICLYQDGTMGFCGRDNEARRLCYGNLKENSLLTLYESVQAEAVRSRQAYLVEHECSNCSDWDLCHGGCAFEAVNYFGRLEAPYPYCQERKKLICYMRSQGLQILKKVLLHQKVACRTSLREKKKLLEELNGLAGK